MDLVPLACKEGMCKWNEVDLVPLAYMWLWNEVNLVPLAYMWLWNEVNLVPVACKDVHMEQSGLSTLALQRCAYGTKWT